MADQNVGPEAGPAPGRQETNSKATWSLIAGILSLTFCGLIAGIVAIIVGKQAQEEIAASGGRQDGESRAKVGIILGWISVAISVLAGIIVAITFVSA